MQRSYSKFYSIVKWKLTTKLALFFLFIPSFCFQNEQPDIVAPGIDILASYTPMRTLTGLKGDTLYSKFTLMSGTSMACPHVSGTAAYVKSFHLNWSPAAIKSAIMTTGNQHDSFLFFPSITCLVFLIFMCYNQESLANFCIF